MYEEQSPLTELYNTYPYYYYSSSKISKGRHGVAILTKLKPLNISYGLTDDYNERGRIITLEYHNFILINTYVSNSGQNLKSRPRRELWNESITNI